MPTATRATAQVEAAATRARLGKPAVSRRRPSRRARRPPRRIGVSMYL